MVDSPILNLVDKTMRTNRTDLARQISITMARFVAGRPMPHSEILATLAFVAGVGVGNSPPGTDKRMLMQMLGRQIAEGEDIASRDVHSQMLDIQAIKNSR